jgi:hypothetical protein
MAVMAARLRLKFRNICNFSENVTLCYNVYLLKYITGNVTHVRRLNDSSSRVPEVEVPFSNG